MGAISISSELRHRHLGFYTPTTRHHQIIKQKCKCTHSHNNDLEKVSIKIVYGQSANKIILKSAIDEYHV